jgi:hypothetical protein
MTPISQGPVQQHTVQPSRAKHSKTPSPEFLLSFSVHIPAFLYPNQIHRRNSKTHGRTSRRLACAPGLSGKMQRNSFLAGAEDILRTWKADRKVEEGNLWRSKCPGSLADVEGGEMKVNGCGGTRSICRAWGKAGTARESAWGTRAGIGVCFWYFGGVIGGYERGLGGLRIFGEGLERGGCGLGFVWGCSAEVYGYKLYAHISWCWIYSSIGAGTELIWSVWRILLRGFF